MKMVKIKTADLIGAQLDWAVAMASGKLGSDDDDEVVLGMLYWCHGNNPEKVAGPSHINPNTGRHFGFFMPSRNWSHGGPIIERERITLAHEPSRGGWSAGLASPTFDYFNFLGYAEAPLVAAMRAFVASKLGDEVKVPEVNS